MISILHHKQARRQSKVNSASKQAASFQQCEAKMNNEENNSERGGLVLYATDDGAVRFFLRVEDGTVWLTQRWR